MPRGGEARRRHWHGLTPGRPARAPVARGPGRVWQTDGAMPRESLIRQSRPHPPDHRRACARVSGRALRAESCQPAGTARRHDPLRAMHGQAREHRHGGTVPEIPLAPRTSRSATPRAVGAGHHGASASSGTRRRTSGPAARRWSSSTAAKCRARWRNSSRSTASGARRRTWFSAMPSASMSAWWWTRMSRDCRKRLGLTQADRRRRRSSRI